MLDPRAPLPLYQQLADELSDQIRSGRFAAGAKIPSEHALASQYSIGRPTVRQATELLVRRKVLVRKRGSGTFVNESPPEVDLLSLGGTLESFRRSGVALQTRLTGRLRRREVTPDADNPFAGQHVYCMERVGLVDKRPVLLERIYLDPAVFPRLDEGMAETGSLSQTVESRYGLRPSGGRQAFKVQLADARLMEVLELNTPAALLMVQRSLDFPGAPAAVYAELSCHTDELVFAQNLGDITHA